MHGQSILKLSSVRMLLDTDDFMPFTIEEVTEVVLSLKDAGPDDIDPEHVWW